MVTFGIHTILTDRMIHPATLGPAPEERGFGALFLAEHSHIPVRTETNHAATIGGVPPIYRRVRTRSSRSTSPHPPIYSAARTSPRRSRGSGPMFR